MNAPSSEVTQMTHISERQYFVPFRLLVHPSLLLLESHCRDCSSFLEPRLPLQLLNLLSGQPLVFTAVLVHDDKLIPKLLILLLVFLLGRATA